MPSSPSKVARYVGTTLLWAFALVGAGVVALSVASELGAFDVGRSVDSHKALLANTAVAIVPEAVDADPLAADAVISCQVLALARYAPRQAELARGTWRDRRDVGLTTGVINATAKDLELRAPITDALARCREESAAIARRSDNVPVFAWLGAPEAVQLQAALAKDAPLINDVAARTGVSGRLIVSAVLPEQLRFFTTNRNAAKSLLEPLQALGVLTRFSLGVSGMKVDTARHIEAYASDASSPYYPGPGMSELLAFPEGADVDAERYRRLTDPVDRTYQYLYTALFLKEVLAQWRAAGHDITWAPQVSVTLFNIGFKRSQPKPNPRVGGVPVTIAGQEILFGQLGYEFFYSGALLDVFPFEAPAAATVTPTAHTTGQSTHAASAPPTATPDSPAPHGDAPHGDAPP
jgi:hypothetical protein